ncbi:hypothetical protein B484DRAFT_337381, partial [Ochromonadaceae sp. CCMP2298]
TTTLYPNEVHSDYAYLPFGAGARKCIGDQFALMESVVTLAVLLKKFDFQMAMRPEDVGVQTGATIHTRNGLKMRVSHRRNVGVGVGVGVEAGAEVGGVEAGVGAVAQGA